MRRFLFIVSTVVLFSLTSCKISEEPEYKRVENIKVAKFNLNNIQLKADAIFNNPNQVGVTIKKTDINVYKDSIFLGKASTPNFEVNKKSEFAIPLTIDFSPKKITQEKGFLKSIFSTLKDQTINITYKGVVTLGVLGVEYDYKLDQTDEIVLKKEK